MPDFEGQKYRLQAWKKKIYVQGFKCWADLF